MKLLVLAIGALLATSSTQASDALETLKSEVRNIAMECAKDSGATEEDVNNFLGKIPPQSQPAHCMLFCVAKRTGSFDANGKYNAAGAKAFFEPIKASNAALHDKLLAIAEKCEEEMDTDADPCTTAANFYKCTLKAEKEMRR